MVESSIFRADVVKYRADVVRFRAEVVEIMAEVARAEMVRAEVT